MSVRDYKLMGRIVAKQAPQLSGKLYRKYVHTVVVRMRQDNSSFPRKVFLDECFRDRPYQYALYKFIGRSKIKTP